MTQQSRPIIEWFKLIPDPEIRDKALDMLAITERGHWNAKSMDEALRKGLTWDIMPGKEFVKWWKILKNIAPTWQIPENGSEETWEDAIAQIEKLADIASITNIDRKSLIHYLQLSYNPPTRKTN